MRFQSLNRICGIASKITAHYFGVFGACIGEELQTYNNKTPFSCIVGVHVDHGCWPRCLFCRGVAAREWAWWDSSRSSFLGFFTTWGRLGGKWTTLRKRKTGEEAETATNPKKLVRFKMSPEASRLHALIFWCLWLCQMRQPCRSRGPWSRWLASGG